MVSGVQNSLGSTAYLKGSKLADSQSSGRQRPEASAPPRETESPSSTRAAERAERSSQSNDNRTIRREDTQLESRNDQQIIRAEQARGSILDLAV